MTLTIKKYLEYQIFPIFLWPLLTSLLVICYNRVYRRAHINKTEKNEKEGDLLHGACLLCGT